MQDALGSILAPQDRDKRKLGYSLSLCFGLVFCLAPGQQGGSSSMLVVITLELLLIAEHVWKGADKER